MEILEKSQIRKVQHDNLQRQKLHIKKSNLVFPNIFTDIEEYSEEEKEQLKINQYLKFKSEYQETLSEEFGSENYIHELLDVIISGINLYHLLTENDLKIYNDVIRKLNRRVIDSSYNWKGIKKTVVGKDSFYERNFIK